MQIAVLSANKMRFLLDRLLPIANPFVKRLLRGRAHWLLSRNLVLLELAGRKSGRIYHVPVSYTPISGGVAIMGYRHRQWWRNIRTNVELPVYLKGSRVLTVPEVIVDDLDAIETALTDRDWMRKFVASAKAEDSVLIRLHIDERPDSATETK